MLLTVVLCENALALLVGRRHPHAALLGVLATYVLVDNEATTLLPMLLVLYAVARSKDDWGAGFAAAVTALAVVVTPVIHGDTAGFFLQTVLPLLAGGLAAAIGINAERTRALRRRLRSSDSNGLAHGSSRIFVQ